MRNIYSIVRTRTIAPTKVASMSRKLSFNVPNKNPTTMGTFVCPTCNVEVSISDLVGKRGTIRCASCVK